MPASGASHLDGCSGPVMPHGPSPIYTQVRAEEPSKGRLTPALGEDASEATWQGWVWMAPRQPFGRGHLLPCLPARGSLSALMSGASWPRWGTHRGATGQMDRPSRNRFTASVTRSFAHPPTTHPPSTTYPPSTTHPSVCHPTTCLPPTRPSATHPSICHPPVRPPPTCPTPPTYTATGSIHPPVHSPVHPPSTHPPATFLVHPRMSFRAGWASRPRGF